MEDYPKKWLDFLKSSEESKEEYIKELIKKYIEIYSNIDKNNLPLLIKNLLIKNLLEIEDFKKDIFNKLHEKICNVAITVNRDGSPSEYDIVISCFQEENKDLLNNFLDNLASSIKNAIDFDKKDKN
jgi:hypothetical protein